MLGLSPPMIMETVLRGFLASMALHELGLFVPGYSNLHSGNTSKPFIRLPLYPVPADEANMKAIPRFNFRKPRSLSQFGCVRLGTIFNASTGAFGFIEGAILSCLVNHLTLTDLTQSIEIRPEDMRPLPQLLISLIMHEALQLNIPRDKSYPHSSHYVRKASLPLLGVIKRSPMIYLKVIENEGQE